MSNFFNDKNFNLEGITQEELAAFLAAQQPQEAPKHDISVFVTNGEIYENSMNNICNFLTNQTYCAEAEQEKKNIMYELGGFDEYELMQYNLMEPQKRLNSSG
ncbi:MAG: hypothetical protein E7Z90_03435 [Cyanobacteria bacterium SIG29]|nr:hypothetical protein [Cyanobacteria bacterium SIG29]